MLLAAVSFSNVSCEKWLDVNKNVDSPDHVDTYLYLSSIQQMYWDIYYDVLATAPLCQMWGTSSYTSYANHRYPTGSDSGGNVWRMVYWDQGMNLENFINQAIDEEKWTMVGMGYAMKAFSWDVLPKQHADLPMTEAFQPGRLEFNYDYQDAIYTQVHDWATTAIEYLEMDDQNSYGSILENNDWIYHGDK